MKLRLVLMAAVVVLSLSPAVARAMGDDEGPPPCIGCWWSDNPGFCAATGGCDGGGSGGCTGSNCGGGGGGSQVTCYRCHNPSLTVAQCLTTNPTGARCVVRTSVIYPGDGTSYTSKTCETWGTCTRSTP